MVKHVYNLIEYLQPIDLGGYQIIEVDGYKENPANPFSSLASLPGMGATFEIFHSKSKVVEQAALRHIAEQAYIANNKKNGGVIKAPIEADCELKEVFERHIAAHYIPTTEKLIVGKSGKVNYSPVHQGSAFQDTFMSFARLGGSDKEIIAFVNRYGFPSESTSAEYYGIDKSLSVFRMEDWSSFQRFFAAILRVGPTDENIEKNMTLAAKYINVEVSKQDNNNSPRLVLVPRNLYAFMLLQFSEYAGGSKEIEFVVCDKCGLHFSRGRGTGRRIDAVYCSTSCYNAANYQKKKARSSGNVKGASS